MYANTMGLNVRPEDSVPQVSRHSAGSSRSSFTSRNSIRVTRDMEAANKADVMAMASIVKEKQSKEEEEMKIRQGKEKVDIDAQILVSEARERVLAEFENTLGGSDVSLTTETRRVTLNIEASLFKPENRPQEHTENTAADLLHSVNVRCQMENSMRDHRVTVERHYSDRAIDRGQIKRSQSATPR